MTLNRKTIIILFFIFIMPAGLFPSNYQSSWLNIVDYGAKNNLSEHSTEAIQRAIDKANANGGGVVYIPEGKFLSGALNLKSNVTLYLEKGAALFGSTDRLQYPMPTGGIYTRLSQDGGFIYAYKQNNIAIAGEGIIDGQGRELAMSVIKLAAAGLLETKQTQEKLKEHLDRGWDFYENPYPRPHERYRPMLIKLTDCNGIRITDGLFKHASSWTVSLHSCNDVHIENIRVVSTAYWNNDGIDLNDCKNVVIRGCDIDSADDGICLKSERRNSRCENIVVDNCRVRSSASAIKFGTASVGGFRNISVTNIYVYNTFRSAIALESVDGGILENVYVNNIRAINTGNAIFMMVGTRGNSYNQMRNVVIENLYCEVPAGKPDAGYAIEGPNERFPHNLFPSTIMGEPNSKIENVFLRNIEIVFAGGATKEKASSSIQELSKQVDHRFGRYPEFSVFGELPAWGLLVRHVDGIKMENIKLVLGSPDYRNAIIFDKANNVKINDITVVNDNKTPLIFNQVDNKTLTDLPLKYEESDFD